MLVAVIVLLLVLVVYAMAATHHLSKIAAACAEAQRDQGTDV